MEGIMDDGTAGSGGPGGRLGCGPVVKTGLIPHL
jgi:hypothetical protein